MAKDRAESKERQSGHGVGHHRTLDYNDGLPISGAGLGLMRHSSMASSTETGYRID